MRPIAFPGWMKAVKDVHVALALGLLAIVTRWAVRGHALYSWDSGNLHAGLREYDFAAGTPHPPFYPVSIGLGKAAAYVVGDVQAFVVLSVLASGVMVGLTYLLARQFASRAIAFLAAGILLLSPVALFNGSVALSYALEGAASVWVAWGAWKARHAAPGPWSLHLGLAASLAVGIRPSSLLFLVPIVLWALQKSPRKWGLTMASGAAVSLAWGLTALWAGGGLSDFRRYTAYQTDRFILREPAWERPGVVLDNGRRILENLPSETPFFLAVALVATLGFALVRRHWPRGQPVVSFLACWTLPAFLFYLVVYAGWPIYPSGYLMVLLPCFAIAAALVLGLVVQGAMRFPGRWAKGAGVVAVALILAIPVTWVADWEDAMAPQRAVEAWEAGWQGMEEAFPPSDTALLTSYAWAAMRSQHPGYLMWHVQPYEGANGTQLVQVAQWSNDRPDRAHLANALDGTADMPHPIPPHIKHVLIIQGHPGGGGTRRLTDHSVQLEEVRGPAGGKAWRFDTAPFATIEQALRWFDEDGMLAWDDWPVPGVRDLPVFPLADTLEGSRREASEAAGSATATSTGSQGPSPAPEAAAEGPEEPDVPPTSSAPPVPPP